MEILELESRETEEAEFSVRPLFDKDATEWRRRVEAVGCCIDWCSSCETTCMACQGSSCRCNNICG
jgi:hypothetical protein